MNYAYVYLNSSWKQQNYIRRAVHTQNEVVHMLRSYHTEMLLDYQLGNLSIRNTGHLRFAEMRNWAIFAC